MRTVCVIFRYDDDHSLKTFLVASNNIPMGVAKARIELTKWCRVNDKDPAKYEMLRASFSDTPAQAESIDDIHRRIMTGRHVSGHDMNRWVRSPKGMMTVAMMNAGRGRS